MRATVMMVMGLMLGMSGCTSTGNWRTLPGPQQDVFNRCWMQIQDAQCGEATSSVYIGECRRSAMSQYSEQRGEEGRKQWLIGRGCPPAMVRPEQH